MLGIFLPRNKLFLIIEVAELTHLDLVDHFRVKVNHKRPWHEFTFFSFIVESTDKVVFLTGLLGILIFQRYFTIIVDLVLQIVYFLACVSYLNASLANMNVYDFSHFIQ